MRRVSSMARVVAIGLLSLLLLCLVQHSGAYAIGTKLPKELYTDLGVTSSATKDEIKKAFRAYTRANHPDLKESYEEKETAKEGMAKVLRAYEVLSDDTKRKDYDEMGVVPGEVPDVESMTPDELFNYYHQHSPIFSKSATLTTLTEVRRLQSFRGNRIFLIQVYDEGKCRSCPLYSNAWETLYQSSLVEAGVLEMYRIDGQSEEGKKLLVHLGIRYRNEPSVAAIVDGEVWTLWGVADVLKGKSNTQIFQHLLEFVMNFYYDVFQKVTSLEVTQMDDILTFLRAPRPANQPLRALIPAINAESIPLALQMRYDQVAVRSAPRDILLEFIEEYCEMEVDVKDRFGEAVPMAEFIVVSTEELPTPPADVTDGAEAAEVEAAAAAATPQKSCRLIHIGAAVALTYNKAARFIESHLPERHVGVSVLREATATDFIDVCRENCLVWVREDCAAAPDAHLTQLLAQPYLSFKTGYWCMQAEPKLAAALTKNGIWTPTAGDLTAFPAAMVAFVGGNDSEVHSLVSLHTKAAEQITSEDIFAALSELVESGEDKASVDGDGKEEEETHEKATLKVRLPHPVSSLLATNGFPMSYKQRVYVQAMNLFGFVAPVFKNTMPFVLMYFVQKYYINRKNPEDIAAEEAQKKAEEEAKKRQEEEAAANAAASPTPTPLRRRIRKPQPRVCPFNPRDMKWAKEEKGFLIFLSEDGSSAGSLPLPPLAMEDPFYVRVLGTGQNNWREWIAAHKPPASEEAVAEVPEAERHLSMMAIRKTRMKATVKSDGQKIDAFLRDLLDGTINPSEELPTWAYDE